MKPRQTICSLENLDLGETSCACPSKMGEGRDGPSHCPLPKVLVRSEEESLKLTVNKNNQILCSSVSESTKTREKICSLENLDLSGLFANKNPTTSKRHRGTKRVVLEEADSKKLKWLLQYLNRTSPSSRTNFNLYKDLNERCQDVLSKNTKESLRLLLKEIQEIYQYLPTKCKTIESLEYKAELERYDIHLELLNDTFNTIIAGLHKLPGFDMDRQSFIDDIFYLRAFPLDHQKKREYNVSMNRARDELQSYYLSYQRGSQEEGKRESQEEDSSPVITIPQRQEMQFLTEDSEVEGWSSSATLEANAGDEERISKPSSSPDVTSKEAEELACPSRMSIPQERDRDKLREVVV